MQELQGKTPFEKGKWFRLAINSGELKKHQMEAWLEEFANEWGPSTKGQFKAGYAGVKKPWDLWR